MATINNLMRLTIAFVLIMGLFFGYKLLPIGLKLGSTTSPKISSTSVHAITYEIVNDNGEVDRAVYVLGLGSDNKMYYWNTLTNTWMLYVVAASSTSAI